VRQFYDTCFIGNGKPTQTRRKQSTPHWQEWYRSPVKVGTRTGTGRRGSG